MKYTLSVAALALGASAAFIPASCTFSLTASGGANGVVGQLGDGQNRVGGSLPKGTYSISNGQITDSHGRGCILTPPTTQCRQLQPLPTCLQVDRKNPTIYRSF